MELLKNKRDNSQKRGILFEKYGYKNKYSENVNYQRYTKKVIRGLPRL